MIDEWIEVSPPVNDSEKRFALTLRKILEPAAIKFAVVTNVRLPNGRGDYSEYDAIIVGEAIVFAIEVKGYGGRITAQRDRWFLEDGASFENPSNRISMKAKVLSSLLGGRDRDLRNKLWVQDLVFVNGIGAKLIDADYARRGTFEVVSTAFDNETALRSALLDAKRWCRAELLNSDERTQIISYLRGGERRVVDDRIGKYVIEERLAPTSERFERLLVKDRYKTGADAMVELHAYPLDGRAASDESLRSAFTRQIGIVQALGSAGVSARYFSDDESSWHGRTVRYVAYEWLGRFETVGDRVARIGAPGLREGLRLGIAIGEAIGTMHDQGIVHGALDPSALYLREAGDGSAESPLRVAIGRVELARPREAGMSVTSSSIISGTASCYASPSILANKHPDIDDDLFSFGATLVHILRGRALFASPNEILTQFRIPKLIEDRSSDPPELQELVRSLLSRSPLSRPRSMRDVLTRLRAILAPLEERRGDPAWLGDFRIIRELRSGATGRTVVAVRRDLDGEVVLKIAPLGSEETLRHEVETLRRLQKTAHPNIVIAYDVKTLASENVLVGEFGLVVGDDGERLRGKIPGAWLLPLAEGLFSALAFVHSHGLVHRDIKPANVMLGPDGKTTVLDFGLAAAPGDTNLIVGTAPYKPERLFSRASWAAADDVFAAAVTFWEIATARHPWNGEAPAGEPELDLADLGPLVDRDVAAALVAELRSILLDASDASNSAEFALNRLRAVLVPKTSDIALPLSFSIVIPTDASGDDPLATVAVSTRARLALEDLGATSLNDVLLLDNADFRSVRVFGRGVTDELAALRVALVARFGEVLPSSKSVLRSVQAAFAPVLIADPDAARTPLEVLGLSPELVGVLFERKIATIGGIASADPTQLARDAKIGGVGVAAIRRALHDFVDDRERLVVEAALPPWRVAVRTAYIDAVTRLGGDPTQAISLLEIAGGFGIDREEHLSTQVPLVAAPPWTVDELSAALTQLAVNATWPPRSLVELTRDIVMPAALNDFVVSFAERIVPYVDGIATTAEGRFYLSSELQLADAFTYGAETLVLPTSSAMFAASVERRLPGFHVPAPGTDEFLSALVAAGFASLLDGRIDRADAVTEANAKGQSDLAGADRLVLSAAALSLIAAVPRGGYRLVVAEPAEYGIRVRALVAELKASHGDLVHVVDVDAELCRVLREEGTLKMAIDVQAKAGLKRDALAAIAGSASRAILDRLLIHEPGSITIAINAGSLGLTGAANHLGAIYDAARGGRYGLIIACVPGDHPSEHARLNRVLPLPIQPTERPIALENVA